MKILHVIPSLSASSGGPPQVAINLVRSLRDAGIDAEIATTNHDHPAPLDVPLHQQVEYPVEGGTIPVWFLPYNRPALKEFIFSSAFTTWCWQHLHHYDLIDNHYLFSYTPTCAAAIARYCKTPYTVRTMGQLAPWALAQSQTKKRIYTHLAEWRNLSRAAAIHCTTPLEAEDVKTFGIQTPTITLPLGVNLPQPIPAADTLIRAEYQIPAETPVILFLSRLHYKKRPDLLLQALAQVQQAGLSFHAIFAGSGEPDYVMQLQQLAATLHLTGQITFPGVVVGPAKEALLQGADLFVLPSFSENFGVAVAEALAAGLPVVITSGVQIAPEIATAAAGLVIENNLEALVAAITQLLTSATLRRQLAENGQQLAQTRYSWPVIAQDLAAAYRQIISETPVISGVPSHFKGKNSYLN